MYQEELTVRINNALRDEISSAMMYNKVSEQAMGTDMNEFAEQLSENADEEYGHFKEILAYAINHAIPVELRIDPIVIGMNSTANIESNLSMIIALENKAYDDYKQISLLAREAQDIETEGFFIEKMNDERKHADGMIKLSKVTPNKPMSFRTIL